jgi:hypothetical protein
MEETMYFFAAPQSKWCVKESQVGGARWAGLWRCPCCHALLLLPPLPLWCCCCVVVAGVGADYVHRQHFIVAVTPVSSDDPRCREQSRIALCCAAASRRLHQFSLKHAPAPHHCTCPH